MLKDCFSNREAGLKPYQHPSQYLVAPLPSEKYDDDYYGDEYDDYYRDDYDDRYGDDEYYDSYSDENYYNDMESSSPEPEPVQPIESIEEDDEDDLEIETDEKMEFTMDFKPRHTALTPKLNVYVCTTITFSMK